ncbi:MAG: TolC family protein, partial [Xanthomonadales bacterium]|nr:TolC family protein [Xanthomonadales bacterium]
MTAFSLGLTEAAARREITRNSRDSDPVLTSDARYRAPTIEDIHSMTRANRPEGDSDRRSGSATVKLRRRCAQAFWAGCCVLALSGCASVPSVTIDLQANVDRIENNTLDDASVHAALVAAGLPAMSPNDEWSLDALVVAAWQFRPELAEARALRSAAAADVDATKSRPSPLVSLIPELVRHASGSSPWTIAAAMSFIVANPSRREAQVDRAFAAAQRTIWQQARVAWQIASEIRTASGRLTLAEHALSLDATERALRAEKWAIARQRVAVGTAARTTLARLEVAEASASQLHDQRLTRRAAALTQLATAIGLPTDGLAAIHLAPSADSPAFAPDWPSLHRTVLFDRLDLAEALSTYAEADAIWREQVASRWPDLTLGPGFAFDRGEHKWTLAVSGELPIGGRLDATTTAAQARRSAAAQHVIAVQAQALGRLAQIRTDWEGAQMSIATTDTAVAAQARLVAAVERRWRAGLTPRED